jgi:hypothetical protein
VISLLSDLLLSKWRLPFNCVFFRVRVTLRRSVYRQSVRLDSNTLETHGQSLFFFQFNAYGHSPYITSFLTRGWVCRLQLLLVLASAFILMFESRRTQGHSLISQFETPPTWRPGPRISNLPEQGGPVTSPGTGVPFRRLLRLAGLRWGYSTPPPHGVR